MYDGWFTLMQENQTPHNPQNQRQSFLQGQFRTAGNQLVQTAPRVVLSDDAQGRVFVHAGSNGVDDVGVFELGQDHGLCTELAELVAFVIHQTHNDLLALIGRFPDFAKEALAENAILLFDEFVRDVDGTGIVDTAPPLFGNDNHRWNYFFVKHRNICISKSWDLEEPVFCEEMDFIKQ